MLRAIVRFPKASALKGRRFSIRTLTSTSNTSQQHQQSQSIGSDTRKHVETSASPIYIEKIYESWLEDPSSVHPSWDDYFRSQESEEFGGISDSGQMRGRLAAQLDPLNMNTTNIHSPLTKGSPDKRDSRLKQYAKLSKIRLTAFVTSTAITGSYIACQSFIESLPVIAIAALGTFLCSSSAAAINQFLETPYDSQMRRTAIRPLVIGQVSPLETVVFALASSLTGLTILATQVNTLTALLGASNIVLYSFVYTPMKRSNVANTWVGSVVGAIPPLMGSTAVLGYVNLNSALLALILFSWQFPHFNALSWNLRHEYARAGYRMMSVVDPDLCKRVALRHSLLLLVYTSLIPFCGSTYSVFSLFTLPLNLQFIRLSWKFHQNADSASSRKLFRFSLLYLPSILGLLIITQPTGFDPLRSLFSEKSVQQASQ